MAGRCSILVLKLYISDNIALILCLQKRAQKYFEHYSFVLLFSKQKSLLH